MTGTERTQRILVVEDSPDLRESMAILLELQGHTVLVAADGATGVELARRERPDVALVDLGLPDMDGVEVCRRLREWCAAPVIVLSARGQERDKIEALDAGADDYVTKPFGIGELLARIRVALRHARSTAGGAEPELRVGELAVDLAARRVVVAGVEVHLTPNEYGLLAELVRNAGKVVTQRQLLKAVWGPGAVGQSHYLRVYMAQLRHKLETEPARPRYLITEPGVGYRLRTAEPLGEGR